MDRKDLKIQALLERVSSLTTDYENRIADLRVELTEVSNELAQERGEPEVSEDEPSIVEGTVV